MTDDPKAPEQDQTSDAISPDDVSKTTVATPEPDGKRVAEAGNQYVGRMMDDDIKTTPRLDGDGTEDAPDSDR